MRMAYALTSRLLSCRLLRWLLAGRVPLYDALCDFCSDHEPQWQETRREHPRDFWLFCAGRHGPRLACSVRRQDTDGFQLVQVGHVCLWWPTVCSPGVLKGLYREVHAAAWRNPHSYFWRDYIRRGSTVWDVGACEGFFSLAALRRSARVVAFEPHPQAAEALRRTFALHKTDDRAVVHPLALGDVDADATLMAKCGAPEVAKLVVGTPGPTVSVAKADTLVFDRGFPPPDVLKIDTEGAEMQVLRGARRMLERDRPKILAAVYHYPRQASEVREFLELLGYRVMTRGLMEVGGQLHTAMLYAE